MSDVYEVTTIEAADDDTTTADTIQALLDKVSEIWRILGSHAEVVTGEDIETEDIVRNTEREPLA